MQSTPQKDGIKHSAQAQDECTPVHQKPKTKRTKKSTRIKKVDSPLGKNVFLTDTINEVFEPSSASEVFSISHDLGYSSVCFKMRTEMLACYVLQMLVRSGQMDSE